MSNKKRVLICPLDWGLGHATRCIPIIEEFLKRDCEVCIASSGSASVLLKNEFPKLLHFELTGYSPHYQRSFFGSMLRQLPKFFRAMKQEHRAVNKIVREQKIDLVISDNRYGCWSALVPSVFITHQVNIRTPKFQRLINALIHRRIRKFTYCWVPDVPGDHSLAGELSAAGKLKVVYIGHLSRLHRSETPVTYRWDVLAIISGPEPQRSIFENIIRQQFGQVNLKTLLVKGIVGQGNELLTQHTKEVNHLGTREMNRVINESRLVVCRSGYSSVMDLSQLEKKAVLVPTPGQTEQEYIGEWLMQNDVAFMMRQNEFDLKFALKESEGYRGFISSSNNLLQKAIDVLI